MVQFSCPLGYDLMGDSDAMCQYGEWEIGANPTCERKSLMMFPKILKCNNKVRINSSHEFLDNFYIKNR